LCRGSLAGRAQRRRARLCLRPGVEDISVDWARIAYALACVVVPIGWGLIVVWVSNRVDRRLLDGGKSPRAGERTPPRPIEYHI
jgi:hypothetical protein